MERTRRASVPVKPSHDLPSGGVADKTSREKKIDNGNWKSFRLLCSRQKVWFIFGRKKNPPMGTGKVSDWCAGLFCVALGDFQKNKRRTLSVMEAKKWIELWNSETQNVHGSCHKEPDLTCPWMHVNERRNFLEIEKQKGFEFQKLKVKEVYERWFERKKIPKFGLKLWRKKRPSGLF